VNEVFIEQYDSTGGFLGTERCNGDDASNKLDEARKLLNDGGFVSAVGHPGTAQLLTELLGVQVPVNRVAVQLKSGDIGIHFVLRERLPEGKVLSKEELAKFNYYFVASYVL
jgi:hypothetical protein